MRTLYAVLFLLSVAVPARAQQGAESEAQKESQTLVTFTMQGHLQTPLSDELPLSVSILQELSSRQELATLDVEVKSEQTVSFFATFLFHDVDGFISWYESHETRDLMGALKKAGVLGERLAVRRYPSARFVEQ